MNDSDGLWIQTYSGKRFHFLSPSPEELDIEDIAHALGLTCRYGGHSRQFFSVAQHCVLASYLYPHPWSLLHDLGEAYLGDIPSPIKRTLPHFSDAEEGILKIASERFNLVWPIPAQVNVVDKQLLKLEMNSMMRFPEAYTAQGLDKFKQRLEDVFPNRMAASWTPEEAEFRFLKRYEEFVIEHQQRNATAQVPAGSGLD